MCNVICVNMKCDRRLPTGFCSRAYPCSECQTIVSADYIHSEIMSPYDRTPFKDLAKDLYERFEGDNSDISVDTMYRYPGVEPIHFDIQPKG